MIRARINRIATIVPLIISALAFALVMANVIAGVPPQPDEDAGAHMWQLLMVTNVLIIVVFAATADWGTRRAPLVLGAQVIGVALACLPVWLAGY
jgi:hypothetical protein